MRSVRSATCTSGEPVDFQRLAMAQARFRGGVEPRRRKPGEERGERQQPFPGARTKLLQGQRLLDAKAAAGGPAQGGEMRAARQCRADVLGEGTDIGSLAA